MQAKVSANYSKQTFFGYIRPNGVKKINKAQQKSVECKKKAKNPKKSKNQFLCLTILFKYAKFGV